MKKKEHISIQLWWNVRSALQILNNSFQIVNLTGQNTSFYDEALHFNKGTGTNFILPALAELLKLVCMKPVWKIKC